MPLAMATRSRRSRIQAICPGDRPWMAAPLAPSRIASGWASGVISSGAAMRAHLPGMRRSAVSHEDQREVVAGFADARGGDHRGEPGDQVELGMRLRCEV